MVCVSVSYNPQGPGFVEGVAGNAVAKQNCAVFGYLSPLRQRLSLALLGFFSQPLDKLPGIISCQWLLVWVQEVTPLFARRNEMCPANATCLFKQKLMVFPRMLRKSAFLAASRILSLRRMLRSLKRESCPVASAVKMLILPAGLTVMCRVA